MEVGSPRWVARVEHHLVGRSSVTLRDIATEPLILPRSRTGLRRVIDDAFARQGLSERVAYEGDDFAIVQGLAVRLGPAEHFSDDVETWSRTVFEPTSITPTGMAP